MAAFQAVALSSVALLAPSAAQAAGGQVIAELHGPAQLMERPGGSIVTQLPPRTEFGSPQVLEVLGRSGSWVRVAVPGLSSSQAEWVDSRSSKLTFSVTPLSIRVQLGSRTLEVRRGGHVLRRFVVGVGGSASPTPTGTFSVTDELPGERYSPAYGCCILALSARQSHLPAGWSGGDRIAIHGTNEPSTIGQSASAGCIHARTADLRYLMKHVPLGTPVTIVR